MSTISDFIETLKAVQADLGDINIISVSYTYANRLWMPQVLIGWEDFKVKFTGQSVVRHDRFHSITMEAGYSVASCAPDPHKAAPTEHIILGQDSSAVSE